MGTLLDTYVARCSEANVRPRRRRFRRIDRKARALIRAMVDAADQEDGERSSPYLTARIDREFYYFVKVVDTAVFVNILTAEEVTGIGY